MRLTLRELPESVKLPAKSTPWTIPFLLDSPFGLLVDPIVASGIDESLRFQ
jgi:hypothetical protein